MVRKIWEVRVMGGRHVLCCGCWGAVVFLLFTLYADAGFCIRSQCGRCVSGLEIEGVLATASGQTQRHTLIDR